MGEIAANPRLEDRDASVLKDKFNRVIELVTSIKASTTHMNQLTFDLSSEKDNLKKNSTELRALEKELGFRTRKPRALKPALKTPVKGKRKSKKEKADLEAAKKLADEQNKLNPAVTTPGDPRQAALPIDKK